MNPLFAAFIRDITTALLTAIDTGNYDLAADIAQALSAIMQDVKKELTK